MDEMEKNIWTPYPEGLSGYIQPYLYPEPITPTYPMLIQHPDAIAVNQPGGCGWCKDMQ